MLCFILAAAALQGIINLNGTLESVSVTLVNPYSGDELTVVGDYYTNDTVVDCGPGSDGILVLSGNDQFVQLEDSSGTLLYLGLGNYFAGGGDDILILASSLHDLGDINIDLGNDDNICWGNVGNESIVSYDGNDRLHGGPGNDVIEAGDGADSLWGSLGDDTLDGEDGIDTAHFPGPFTNYAITGPADLLTVEDLVGDEGTDQLIDVELLRFADGVLSNGTFTPFPAEVFRNGTPPNPAAFLPGVTSGPESGLTWDPVIDHTTFVTDATTDFAVLSGGPIDLFLGAEGTLLCSPAVGPILTFFAPAPGSPFAIRIPTNPSFIGLSLCVQGGSIDAAFALHLANALDITIGAF